MMGGDLFSDDSVAKYMLFYRGRELLQYSKEISRVVDIH